MEKFLVVNKRWPEDIDILVNKSLEMFSSLIIDNLLFYVLSFILRHI